MAKFIRIFLCIILFVELLWMQWLIGGIHLDYLKESSMLKAEEICGEDSEIVYQGYERCIFRGFGGRVWYQCKTDNAWYEFALSRRINNPELQVYNFTQKTIFPTSFQLNQ